MERMKRMGKDEKRWVPFIPAGLFDLVFWRVTLSAHAHTGAHAAVAREGPRPGLSTVLRMIANAEKSALLLARARLRFLAAKDAARNDSAAMVCLSFILHPHIRSIRFIR
jgi:hypothetical protein